MGGRPKEGEGIFEVLVEIPRGSRNKYEYDHARGVMRLDRRLFSATVYPADYGFVPHTLGEDGDELDALVLLEDPTFPGCHVDVRAVGVFWMTDEAGPDAKLICVPAGDPRWDTMRDISDIPEFTQREIEHFFDIYKMLEPAKDAETGGFAGAAAAYAELEASRRRFEDDAGHR